MTDWVDWEREFNRRFQTFIEREPIQEASLLTKMDTVPGPGESFSPFSIPLFKDFLCPYEGWGLPLEALRRLPRYLCGMTLLSDRNLVNQGHYEYWRYTGGYASVVSGYGYQSSIPTPTVGEKVEPDSEQFSMTLSELNDFCLALYLGLLAVQKHKIRLQRYGPSTPGQPHPSLEKLVEHSFNITTRYGFPVLEGLAGKWWGQKRGRLQNKLTNWTENTDNDHTKATLAEINALPTRVDVEGDIIDQLYDIALQSLEKPFFEGDKRDGVFRQLKEARGDTLHGDESYSGPAVVVVTLSCLAFWDLMDSSEYKSIREWIKAEEELDHYLLDWKSQDFYNPTITFW